MYVGVKLVNYPHLYYFSHFTHFTLYLRKCEKYQILFNFVLISKFPLASWRLLHSFKGVWKNISFCSEVLKGWHSQQETLEIIPVSLKLQLLITTQQLACKYSVVKISKNLYKLVVRRLQVHKIHPAYELTQLYLLHGPLKYFEWSAAIKTLCNYITDHLELLLEHILNTYPDEMWQEKYDQSVELFSRMCKALENFVSLKHPHTCVKCQYN